MLAVGVNRGLGPSPAGQGSLSRVQLNGFIWAFLTLS